jgi:DNA-binding NarL/FixJ family response regulator
LLGQGLKRAAASRPLLEIIVNMNILLVDDHPLLLRGLGQALTQQPDFILAGQARTGAMALELARELNPDLMVMDIHLPDINGIEATRQVLKVLPAIKIVIFSCDPARSLADQALQAGARAYVLKSNDLEELVRAINLVMEGRLYLSPELNSDILEDYRESLLERAKPSKPFLSQREKQLLRLVAEGRRNKEIAEALKMNVHSVETYRSRLMKKLGCSSTAALTRYAIREGIAQA